MSKYNLPLQWKLYYGFICIVYLSLAIAYLLNNSAVWRDTVAFLICSYLAGYHFFRFFDQLRIDENEFQYRTLGTVYSGKWSDVQRLAKRGIYDGVYLPKARLTSGNNWSTPQDLFVPLSLFIPKWQESMLGRKINEYILQTKNRIMNH